jgi:CheY-like chemotaxis protein
MASSPTRPRVLIIEDEFLIAIAVQEMLEDLGCEVISTVGTLAEGLEHCAATDADAAVLNLILHGESAYALASILAARKIPFGFASGANHGYDMEGWTDRPFLSKPYSDAGIRAFLLEVLPDHVPPN